MDIRRFVCGAAALSLGWIGLTALLSAG